MQQQGYDRLWDTRAHIVDKNHNLIWQFDRSANTLGQLYSISWRIAWN